MRAPQERAAILRGRGRDPLDHVRQLRERPRQRRILLARARRGDAGPDGVERQRRARGLPEVVGREELERRSERRQQSRERRRLLAHASAATLRW